LQIAPSCYRLHAARQRNPELNCTRAKRDQSLILEVQRVWHANWQVYGARKVWKQMGREGIGVARCTVERLMGKLGLAGARRGKRLRTTTPDTSAPCPLDRVNRQFKASRPNELWVSDFTYVSTWQGWLFVAFVIDVYARRIVGWRVSHSMRTDFVLDALEQALYDRQPQLSDQLIHHSDRGSQYVNRPEIRGRMIGQVNRPIKPNYDGQTGWAWNLTPNARATFSTVAKLGLPSALRARYKLSRLRPASRATWVIPLARAMSPSALAMPETSSGASSSQASRYAAISSGVRRCSATSYGVVRVLEDLLDTRAMWLYS
jgi:transposase InsO family protein